MLEPRFHLWRSYAECDIGTSNSFRLSVCLSVRHSVRPSHIGIVSKRLNISSKILQRLIAESFCFFRNL